MILSLSTATESDYQILIIPLSFFICTSDDDRGYAVDSRRDDKRGGGDDYEREDKRTSQDYERDRTELDDDEEEERVIKMSDKEKKKKDKKKRRSGLCLGFYVD